MFRIPGTTATYTCIVYNYFSAMNEQQANKKNSIEIVKFMHVRSISPSDCCSC